MITVKNRGNDLLVVRNSKTPHEVVHVRPMEECSLEYVWFGHYIVDHVPIQRVRSRFDPRGGDPYNRTGSKAFP